MSTTENAGQVGDAMEVELRAAVARIKKQGPCAMCGGPYARHRVIDAYVGMLGAGETVAEVANWYDTEARHVMAEIVALSILTEAGE